MGRLLPSKCMSSQKHRATNVNICCAVGDWVWQAISNKAWLERACEHSLVGLWVGRSKALVILVQSFQHSYVTQSLSILFLYLMPMLSFQEYGMLSIQQLQHHIIQTSFFVRWGGLRLLLQSQYYFYTLHKSSNLYEASVCMGSNSDCIDVKEFFLQMIVQFGHNLDAIFCVFFIITAL